MENVSHNTSYSEGSPNVKVDDEEFSNNSSQQLYSNRNQDYIPTQGFNASDQQQWIDSNDKSNKFHNQNQLQGSYPPHQLQRASQVHQNINSGAFGKVQDQSTYQSRENRSSRQDQTLPQAYKQQFLSQNLNESRVQSDSNEKNSQMRRVVNSSVNQEQKKMDAPQNRQKGQLQEDSYRLQLQRVERVYEDVRDKSEVSQSENSEQSFQYQKNYLNQQLHQEARGRDQEKAFQQNQSNEQHAMKSNQARERSQNKSRNPQLTDHVESLKRRLQLAEDLKLQQEMELKAQQEMRVRALHHKHHSSNLQNATDFEDEEADEDQSISKSIILHGQVERIDENQHHHIIGSLMSSSGLQEYGRDMHGIAGLLERDSSNQQSPILHLSQRIIHLQSIFKCMDLVHYHQQRHSMLKFGFQSLRMNCLNQQVCELIAERKELNNSVLFQQTKNMGSNFQQQQSNIQKELEMMRSQKNQSSSQNYQQVTQLLNNLGSHNLGQNDTFLLTGDSQKSAANTINAQLNQRVQAFDKQSQSRNRDETDGSQNNGHERIASQVSNIQLQNNSSMIKVNELQSLQVLENLLNQIEGNIRKGKYQESLSSKQMDYDQNDDLITILKQKFKEELKTITAHYEEIERLRTYLNSKIDIVEQMELENLESHLVQEHRLKSSEEYRRSILHQSNVGTQTDLASRELIQQEKALELRKNDLELTRFKEKQEFQERERALLRRERELDIRERVTEERKMEYTYKHRELNQRMNQATQWPLNCLDNNQKLASRLLEIKSSPDLFKGLALESDQGFQEFKLKEPSKSMLKSLEGTELFAKMENLLKYEYSILQERTKFDIAKDYFESEILKMENERLELREERDRYAQYAEKERQIEEERRVIDEEKLEVQLLVESIKKALNQLIMNEKMNGLNAGSLGILQGSGLQQANLLEYLNGTGPQNHNQSQSLGHSLARIEFPFSMNQNQPQKDASSNISSLQSSHHTKNPSSQQQLSMQITKPYGVGSSVFDQALQRSTQNLMQSAMVTGMQAMTAQQQYHSDSNEITPLSKRIETILSHFDKLSDLYMVSKDDKKRYLKKQESTLESLKKIIMREAYFLEQERKFLSEKQSKLQAYQMNSLSFQNATSIHNNSKLLLSSPVKQGEYGQTQVQRNLENDSLLEEGQRMLEKGLLSSPTPLLNIQNQSQNTSMIQNNQPVYDYHTLGGFRVADNLDEERKKVQLLQQSLIMENELNQSLQQQLNSEIQRVQDENEKLNEMERNMNEQKLKMLIKFERIKQLEDYYNQRNPQSQVSLELEVTDEEMLDVAKSLREKQRNPPKRTSQQKYEILLSAAENLSFFLVKKHQLKINQSREAIVSVRSGIAVSGTLGDDLNSLNSSGNESEDSRTLAQYFIIYWKMQTLQHRLESQKTRNLLIALDKPSLQKLGLMPQFKREFGTSEPSQDWFEYFWQKKSRQLNAETFVKMNGEQLYLANKAYQEDIERFWRFRSANVIRMVNLHMKRRARLLLAFSFQQYKYQAMKAKVQIILSLKEGAAILGHNRSYSIGNEESHTFMNRGGVMQQVDYQKMYEDLNIDMGMNAPSTSGGNPLLISGQSRGEESSNSVKMHNTRYQKAATRNLGGSFDTSDEIQADQIMNQMIEIGTPQLAGSRSSIGDGFDDKDKIIMIGTAASQFHHGTGGSHIRIDTIDTQNSQTYTGISDIIHNHQLQQQQQEIAGQNLKKSAILTYLLFKKDSIQSSRLKNMGLNRWKNFMRELENWAVKTELRRLGGEVQNLKFQEQLMRTTFRVQKSELESKVSELISYCMSSQALQNGMAPISY